jgi:hypothetical protein
MREYTNVPIPNTKMAERFIRDNVAGLGSRYAKMAETGSPRIGQAHSFENHKRRVLAKVVNTFMGEHPRGKWTASDLFKRQFYAACYAIAISWSRRRDPYMKLERAVQARAFNNAETKALLAFPADGSALDAPKLGGTRVLDSLIGLGLITGYWVEHNDSFKPERIWLTDRGIYAHKIVAERDEKKARQKTSDQFTRGRTSIVPKGYLATIDIAGDPDVINILGRTQEESEELREKVLRLLKADALNGGV